MTQLGHRKGLEAEIKPGDIVRLLKPFRPERYSYHLYAFGVVVGVVTDDSTTSEECQSISDSTQTTQKHQPRLDGFVVYLYEPSSSTIYVDQFGVKALYSFDADEVELYKAIQTSASK